MAIAMTPEEESGGSDGTALDSWLAGLQGRPLESNMRSAFRMGSWFRTLVMQDLEARAGDDSASADRLLDSWKSNGLIESRPPAVMPDRSGASLVKRLGGRTADTLANVLRGRPWVWLALPTMACGLWLLMPNDAVTPTPGDPDGPEGASIMRGDEPVQPLVASNPHQVADRIEALLRKYKVPVRRVVISAEVIEIQAKVPIESRNLITELTGLGVSVPPHGRLRVNRPGF